MKKRKKTQNGIAMCKCCNLSYWQSGVLGGLTIVLEREGTGENVSIDIPLAELPKLKKVINKVITTSKKKGGIK